MAQYDVYENTDSATRVAKPYLLDVQSELLETLTTRVVVPLISGAEISHPVEILNPMVQVLNQKHFASCAEICSVPTGIFGKKITHLNQQQRDNIENALGLLLT